MLRLSQLGRDASDGTYFPSPNIVQRWHLSPMSFGQRRPKLRRADRRILNKLAWRRAQFGVSERSSRIEAFALERCRLEQACVAALKAGGRYELNAWFLREVTSGR